MLKEFSIYIMILQAVTIIKYGMPYEVSLESFEAYDFSVIVFSHYLEMAPIDGSQIGFLR